MALPPETLARANPVIMAARAAAIAVAERAVRVAVVPMEVRVKTVNNDKMAEIRALLAQSLGLCSA